MSHETTFGQDVTARLTLETALFWLAHGLLFRLLAAKMDSATLALKIRSEDFITHSIQKTFEAPLTSIEEIFQRAKELLSAQWDGRTPLRLIGLGFQRLQPTGAQQQELFDETPQKRRKIQQLAQGLETKFQHGVLSKARLIAQPSAQTNSQRVIKDQSQPPSKEFS